MLSTRASATRQASRSKVPKPSGELLGGALSV
jgi:hypothetical protein